MPVSVDQLLTPTTEEQAITLILDTLESLGFITTSWQDGSVQRNLVQAFGRTYSQLTETVRNIVNGVLVEPTGLWLDLVGIYRYGIERLPAVRAVRNVEISNAASGTPQVVTLGSYLSNAAGTRWRTDAEVTVLPGTTETVSVTAEFGGVAGNAVEDGTLVFSQPTYSGLTAVFAGAPTTLGVEAESDARYFRRIQLRWAELTFSVGLRAYELWALTAAPSVRRAKALNNYPIENAVRIVIDPGVASEITQVENYVAPRNPPNDAVTVQAASVVTQAIVYSPRIFSGTTVAAMNARITAMLDALPIGGTPVAGAPAGRLLRDKIAEALLCATGLRVQSVGLTTPATDIVLGATDIVKGAYTVTPELVI